MTIQVGYICLTGVSGNVGLDLLNGLKMGKKSQKSRLNDVKRSKAYLSDLSKKFDELGRFTSREMDSVCEILSSLREGVKGRLGKRERELVEAAQVLMEKVEARRRSGEMSEEDLRMWSYATGTWKVIAEQMLPINKQAVRDQIRYRDWK